MMEQSEQKSSIKLLSNIMLKSRYDKASYLYLPPDVLPPYFSDVRAQGFLTQEQRNQYEKRLFYAKKIIDEWTMN